MVTTISAVIAFFFVLQEGFHVFAHLNVLFRFQPPTLEEIKRRKYYFLWDGMSHFLPYFIHGRFLPYIIIQFIAHMFYVSQWSKQYYAIRIMEWSAKEYNGKWITVDFFLTWADIIGHALNVWALSQFIGAWVLMICWIPYPLLIIVTRNYYSNKEEQNHVVNPAQH